MPGACSWYLTCWSVIEGLHRCQPTNPSFGLTRPEQCPPARAPSTSPNILHQTWEYKWKQYRSDHIHSKDSFHPFRSCFAPFFDILKIGSDKSKGNVTRLEYSILKMYANKQNMTESWQVTKKEYQIYLCELSNITWCADKKYARMDLLMRKKDKRSVREGEVAG